MCGRLNLPLSFYKHLLYDQESEGKFFTSYYMDELALFTSCTFYQRGSRSGTVWASVLWHVLMDCRYGRNRLSDTVLPSWDMACTVECDSTVKKVHMLGLSLWMTAADLRCVLPGFSNNGSGLAADYVNWMSNRLKSLCYSIKKMENKTQLDSNALCIITTIYL